VCGLQRYQAFRKRRLPGQASLGVGYMPSIIQGEDVACIGYIGVGWALPHACHTSRLPALGLLWVHWDVGLHACMA
jgi:hypothetical protein